MKKIIIPAFTFFLFKTTAAQIIMPLYEKVPNFKASAVKEITETTDGILRISKVSVPTLTMYRPAAADSTGIAVIICPGGGYARLSAGKEGSDVAKLFNEWGITAFVLKYRLPDDSMMTNRNIVPLQDAQRAIQMVRENAAAWNINPGRIGIMGFSAGGHLAATASTHFNNVVIENRLNTSVRPDFSILIYPVISLTDSLAHTGSRNNLIGKIPTPEMISLYSNEMQITAQTPPAFLLHASDDKTVPVNNSIVYYQQLIAHKIAAEMHIYQNGGHGFGLNNKTTADKWSDRLKNWMLMNKLL